MSGLDKEIKSQKTFTDFQIRDCAVNLAVILEEVLPSLPLTFRETLFFLKKKKNTIWK